MQTVQQTEPVRSRVPASSGDGARLLALAQATRTATTSWSGSADWSTARNAHMTNTAEQMRAALGSNVNWLEGDVRRDARGSLVMAHASGEVGEGLSLDEWLAIGSASGRGVKVELKEPAAFDAYLEAVSLSGIEQSRLILNVPVAGRHGVDVLSDEQLLRLRRRLPDATINLSPTGHHAYDDTVVGELARTARLVGGSTMFPMQWDLLTSDVITGLRPFGRVAVWVSPSWGSPRDPESESVSLQARGVDGMIDLGEPAGIGTRVLAAGARGLGVIFGRQAVVDARDAVIGLFR